MNHKIRSGWSSRRGASWYEPTEFGYEKTVRERMEFWRQLRREGGKGKGET